jgi:hypothetical protein
MKHKGVIYILTNPAFPQYVKIGYAQDLEKRLKQLNRSETIPYAFRAYAVYDVESELTDRDLHTIIDSINPDLRTIENFDGKKRVKEFYAMSAEDAYHLLECIAKISGTTNRLKRMKPEGHEIEDRTRRVKCRMRRGEDHSGLACAESAPVQRLSLWMIQAKGQSSSMTATSDSPMKRPLFPRLQNSFLGASIQFRERSTSNTTAKSSTTSEKSANETTNS